MASTLLRKDFIDLCRLAEQTERYEDMLITVKSILQEPDTEIEFSVDERNIFSAAFKNILGIKRSSWRAIRTIEQNTSEEVIPGQVRKQHLAKQYRQKIMSEISELCKEVAVILDTKLIPAAHDDESKVFYIKMKADYCRYLAEVCEDDERALAIDTAQTLYCEALELSKQALKSTHPLRLGLALNYSVFFYEILKEKDQAQKLAKSAFNCAISELDTLVEESYKDSTLVLQLIRDNLSLWSSETQHDSDTNTLAGLLESGAAIIEASTSTQPGVITEASTSTQPGVITEASTSTQHGVLTEASTSAQPGAPGC